MPVVVQSGARRRSLIVPREHGAWGILLVPLFTGSCVGLCEGGSTAGIAPLAIVTLALFWLRTPVESWIGTAPIRARTQDEFRLVRNAALGLAMVSGSALMWLFWGGQNRALLWIGSAAGLAFLFQAAVKRNWRNARTAAQMIGAAGLTSTAPAAYYVVTGRFGIAAWILWAANLLLAVNQIHFVHVRIRAARAANRREKLSVGRWFLIGQVLLTALLAAARLGRLIQWHTAAAFVPVLFRGFAWFAGAPQPLAVPELGKSELVYAAIFCALLVAGTGVL